RDGGLDQRYRRADAEVVDAAPDGGDVAAHGDDGQGERRAEHVVDAAAVAADGDVLRDRGVRDVQHRIVAHAAAARGRDALFDGDIVQRQGALVVNAAPAIRRESLAQRQVANLDRGASRDVQHPAGLATADADVPTRAAEKDVVLDQELAAGQGDRLVLEGAVEG